MGKLTHIKAQLDGTPTREVLVDSLFEGLFKATVENAQRLSSDVSGSITEARKASESGLQQATNDLKAEIAQLPKPLLEAFVGHHDALNARVDRLEQMLADFGPKRDKAVSTAVDALESRMSKSMQGFARRLDKLPKPEKVDLDPISQALVALSAKKVDLSVIEKKLDKPKKWVLTPVYKDFGNEIDHVIAEEV